MKLLLITALATIALTVDLPADRWNPPQSLDELPKAAELPKLFEFAASHQAVTADNWLQRRRELEEIVQFYEYGRMPPRPDVVTAEQLQRRELTKRGVTEELMTLVIGSKHQLRMRIAVYSPGRSGRLPVFIREEAALGHLEEVPRLMERGYMYVEYARDDLDPDRPGVVGAAQSAYPAYDWATLSVWAWAGMRVVDYLESRDDVDRQRIGIVGHSRGGKAALLAGALDTRFSLVAPNGSGCGGAGSFRVQGDGGETLGEITDPERFAYWFHPRLRWFVGRENRLPFDQHFLKALVAPRALICTEANNDLWANPKGTRFTSRAAGKAFRLLGEEAKNGLHFRDGDHNLSAADWNAILEFADWHWFGRQPSDPKRFQP